MPVPRFSTPVERRELSSLYASKGTGRDAIRPKMVRWLADSLAEPLPAAVPGLNAANPH